MSLYDDIKVYGIHFIVVVVVLLSGCGRFRQSPTLSYRQILDQMADLALIADLSTPGSIMFSSWDRTGGNNDFGNYLKDGPKGWKVLAEVNGSGYISRFWCTGSKNGDKRIRIYVDDDRKPAIETTLNAWFGRAGFTEDLPLRGYEPYCWFSWLPVSFSRSLTVMQEAPVGDEKLYYQINVNLLPEGQIAESWNSSLIEDADIRSRLDRLKATWTKAQLTDTNGMGDGVVIAAGQEHVLWQAEGADVIRSVRFNLVPPEGMSVAEREALLRALVVRMYWDETSVPSVNVPLGALGGGMWHEMQYGTAYFGMSSGVFRLSFPLPYRKGARIAVLNEAAVDIAVQLAVQTVAQPPSAELGYFHAGWRKSTAEHVGRPHVVTRYAGEGKYIGCQLGVRSLDKSFWVLESDECIYVDGERDASWKGTGLEDYFNGGWYYGNVLASPFHGIVFKALARTQQYRLHPFDPVAFKTQLQVEFERGPERASTAEFESVSYCYLRQPQAADSDLRSPAYRKPVDDPLAMYTVMTEVLNMERLGDGTAAINTIRNYQALHPTNPFNEVFNRRIQHYYKPSAIAGGKGILGVYANAPFKVFLSGAPMIGANEARGDRVHFQEVSLPPGDHVLAVQFANRPYPDVVQVMLEYPGGFVGTDNTWTYTFNPPGTAWSRVDFDGSKWPMHGNIWVKGPPEEPTIWCEPNDRPWTQSRAWGLRPSADWPPERGHIVFRKRFVVE